MYQILSLKENMEYIITEDEWFAENYTKYSVMKYRDTYSRPLFQTLLDFLNFDYHKKAKNDFINLVCACSDNYMMEESANTVKLGYGKYGDCKTNDRVHRQELFCKYLYMLFPDDKKKKPISELKTHRVKGMTINKLFEHEATEHQKRCNMALEPNRVRTIELLRQYLIMAENEFFLNNPFIFRLYVNEFMENDDELDRYRQFHSDCVGISIATPFIKEFADLHATDINRFTNIAISACSDNNKYDEYIIKTMDDAYGHDENPFAFDNGLSELNIVMSDIYFILQQGWNIRRCPNCGKYFVNRKRKDVKYCSNPAPLDITKTCEQYAKTRGYYLKNKNDELEHLRTQIKDRLRQRAARNGGKDIERCNQFKEYDKPFRKYSRDNDKDNLYLDWLKKVDQEIKKGGGKIPKPPM